MSYSQNNEEEIIIAQLDRMNVQTGRFLDIGAWNGKGFSNTFRLTELGWSGVCVEPSPVVFPDLIKNHGSNPKIELVNTAISPDLPRLVRWYDSGGDAISTTSPAHKEKWEKGWHTKFTAFWIYTMPMRQLFDGFGYDFDFINIDVEDTNIDLFRALPWPALTKMKIICVEHDLHQNEMSQLAAKHGFMVLGVNGENLIFTRLP